MSWLLLVVLVLLTPGSAVEDTCEEVEVVLEPEVDVWVGHWQFAGRVGVEVCAGDREMLDVEARGRLRQAYEEIISELHLLSLRLCWTEPPDERWTLSGVQEFKGPYLERLNQALPAPVLRDMTCELAFVEYEPSPPEDGARQPVAAPVSRPLLSPAGALALPLPSPRPQRLAFLHYQSPC